MTSIKSDPSNVSKDLIAASDVLDNAAQAIMDLKASLLSDQANVFTYAIDCLASVAGRVILTGMGKSGYIARKIAATLASTGTLASYVHPAEAAHGDLGMISANDAVIAVSNSGETAELNEVINYTKRFAIPLIGFTSKRESTLGERGDFVLCLPQHREACPIGLAPTTSTTATLALGDAVAMALLQRKGFTETDFSVFHPGGKLGRRFVLVREIMHPLEAIPLAAPDTLMSEIVVSIPSGRFGCCGVINPNGNLIGIITDGDLRRHMAPNLLSRPASEIMTTEPKTISAHALASEALGFINRNRITGVFVVEDNEAVGFVHVHDLLQAGVM